ncbi:MAG: hypothetical protein WD572_11495 [Gammaproteobacteria bacterium]
MDCSRNTGKQQGQAMTELAIVAAAVLVPLFLLIPLLGKQIDLKHSAVQAARYEVWEYTVWYSGSNKTPDGFNATSQPIKSVATTQAESQQRFFSNTALPITNADSGGWDDAAANPLWNTHVPGQRLFDGDIASDTDADDPTPDPGGIFGGILDAIDTVFSLLADIAAFLNLDVGFTAINTDGYFKSQVMAKTEEVGGFMTDEPLFPATTVTAQAAVLTDSWNAGGREHAAFQVGGIVPTRALGQIVDKTPFREIWGLIGIIAPELRLCDPWIPLYSGDGGSLWLGHIDFDTVHPDRLVGSNSGTHVCNDGGFCDFDPIPDRVPKVLGSNLCAYAPP